MSFCVLVYVSEIWQLAGLCVCVCVCEREIWRTCMCVCSFACSSACLGYWRPSHGPNVVFLTDGRTYASSSFLESLCMYSSSYVSLYSRCYWRRLAITTPDDSSTKLDRGSLSLTSDRGFKGAICSSYIKRIICTH
jgi:hypothetical protein